MPTIVITPPAAEPISLTEAKLQCRVDGSADDALLGVLITAAREQAENELGRALITQTRELVLDEFPDACVLRGAPVQSITSVKYLDTSGVEQTMNLADTLLDKDSSPGALYPAYGKVWPATYAVPNAVRVRYTCGYGAAGSNVPESIRHWMLIAIATWYAHRESIQAGQVIGLPDRFWHRLLDAYRIYE